ncbi:MAG: SulP family inorganic anion transporter [Parvibaculales bacterium]
MKDYFPIFDWSKNYGRADFEADSLAAVIVTIMLIPQSLAYAMLAGLPPQVGLYASMLPLVAYMIFGTSHALAVGPVAVVSLMTAAALGNIAATGSAGYLAGAVMLAFLSGVILLVMGVLKLGFLAYFLSQPVISGFITASGLLIAVSQLDHLLGLDVSGRSLPALLQGLWLNLPQTNFSTLFVGGTSLAALALIRSGLQPLLLKAGLSDRAAGNLAKAGPLAVILLSIGAVVVFDMQGRIAVTGEIPRGLPPLQFPVFDRDLIRLLLVPALLISIIGFVESVSVGQTLAAKAGKHIQPDHELVGLGSANLVASLSGGYPVTGGFARSVVNFDAGAATPAAGGLTALGIALATLFFTPYLYFLPKAVLAATIIIAVLSLVDLSPLKASWTFSRSDFIASLGTIAVTLLVGVEAGVATGVLASLGLYLYKASQPHIAEIGQVPGTQHFRNVKRHDVITSPKVLSLRIDENMFFANARYIENYILSRLDGDEGLEHVTMNFASVSLIDSSGQAVLHSVNKLLSKRGASLSFTELKGPVEDRLKRGSLLQELSGSVYLHHYEAMTALDPAVFPPLRQARLEAQEAADGSHI